MLMATKAQNKLVLLVPMCTSKKPLEKWQSDNDMPQIGTDEEIGLMSNHKWS